MNNSEKLQGSSEIATQDFKKSIAASIAVAFDRTSTEPFNIDNMVADIHAEFGHLSVNEVMKAIRNGSLGAYGRTYKLCTQEVCVWIRAYLSSPTTFNPANLNL